MGTRYANMAPEGLILSDERRGVVTSVCNRSLSPWLVISARILDPRCGAAVYPRGIDCDEIV